MTAQVFNTVIHRHNDERKTAAGWRKCGISAIMAPIRKGAPHYGSQIHRRTTEYR